MKESKNLEQGEMLQEYKRDWLSFLEKDEFQAFIFVTILVGLFKVFGFVDMSFFQQVFLYSLGFAFGDNAISSLLNK